MSGGSIEIELLLASPTHTAAVGEALGRALRGGDVLALEGELGAGKTSLVRGLAAGLGVDAAAVASPTFVRIVEHEPAGDGAGPWLVHVDAYRMSGAAELEELGWGPDLLAGAVVAIEWASRVLDALPADRVDLILAHAPGGGRTLTVRGAGDVVTRLRAARSALRCRRRRCITSRTMSETPAEAAPTCPVCESPLPDDRAASPFCGPRCRTIDMGRWLDGRYAISRPLNQADLEE